MKYSRFIASLWQMEKIINEINVINNVICVTVCGEMEEGIWQDRA